MASKGDVIKACDEMRPTVKEWLNLFKVDCGRDERLRVREISDDVGDYDPAGKFSYMMYAAMLAAGDDSMDDLEVYNYYLTSLGEFLSPDDSEAAFIEFMSALYRIAESEIEDREVKINFEKSTIGSIRLSFMDSDIFSSVIRRMESEIEEKMLKLLVVDSKMAVFVLRTLHTSMTNLVKSIGMPVSGAIMNRVDEKAPEDGSDVIKSKMIEIARGDVPDELMSILRILSVIGGAGGLDDVSVEDMDSFLEGMIGSVQNAMEIESPDVSKGMVYLRRVTLMLTGLYILIASGDLGLSGNRSLAYKIRDTVNSAVVRGEMRGTDVLKLEKASTPELPILLN